MKAIILTLITFFSFLVNTENTNMNEYEECIIEVDLSNSMSDWGSWRRSACYKGIWHRTRNDGNSWEIQFSNTYKYRAHFTYEIWANKSKTKYISINNRTECRGNQGETGSIPFVTSRSTVYIVVKRLRLDKYKGEYDSGELYNCDR